MTVVIVDRKNPGELPRGSLNATIVGLSVDLSPGRFGYGVPGPAAAGRDAVRHRPAGRPVHPADHLGAVHPDGLGHPAVRLDFDSASFVFLPMICTRHIANANWILPFLTIGKCQLYVLA
jgi:hypothetical protein